MTIEKLNLEDLFVMELLGNKINEIIDTINDVDDRLSQRVSDNWKHHKQMVRQIDEIKEKMGQRVAKEAPNGSISDERKDS
jgi:hypothetical protein